MFDHGRNVNGERVSLGSAQTFDLLGYILPADRSVPAVAGCCAKFARLLLRPKHEVLVIAACHGAAAYHGRMGERK
jgi:hypothetical protein